ncbi:MAG: hypothetical protein FWD06_06905 [Oscillospiraceae bacterium]|nr:hypothetical protein [Oscillospiraceae bacterium]
MAEKNQLEDVLKGYRKLAFGESNDALKLLFMGEDVSWSELEDLDVFNISEITRAKQGGNMVIKFYNRFEAMRHLVEVGGLAQVPQGVKMFYDAIERSIDSN